MKNEILTGDEIRARGDEIHKCGCVHCVDCTIATQEIQNSHAGQAEKIVELKRQTPAAETLLEDQQNSLIERQITEIKRLTERENEYDALIKLLNTRTKEVQRITGQYDRWHDMVDGIKIQQQEIERLQKKAVAVWAAVTK